MRWRWFPIAPETEKKTRWKMFVCKSIRIGTSYRKVVGPRELRKIMASFKDSDGSRK